MAQLDATDPRPRVTRGPAGVLLAGRRCVSCAEVAGLPWPRCPACGEAVEPATFGPEGTVWSSTVVRIPVSGRTLPYGLAYVDLDNGPRVLAHVDGVDTPAPIGCRVRLAEPASDGDLHVELVR